MSIFFLRESVGSFPCFLLLEHVASLTFQVLFCTLRNGRKDWKTANNLTKVNSNPLDYKNLKLTESHEAELHNRAGL